MTDHDALAKRLLRKLRVMAEDHCAEAADLIEQQAAEIARKDAALEAISNHRYDAGGAYEMCTIASQALKGQP